MRKLSDIKGRESMVVMAKIITPIANLVNNDEVLELMKQKPIKEGQDAYKVAIERLSTALPALMDTNADDFIALMSTIDGKTPEEYEAEMTLASLLQDLATLMSDPMFKSFLP